MYHLVRPLLFRLDAERAHTLTLTLLRWGGQIALARFVLRRFCAADELTSGMMAFGVPFPNRVGLAAGYDKNGVAVRGLSCLGFGHIEIGTVTRQPQIGNPRPRVWRVVEAQGIINSMGFPNAGVDALKLARSGVRIGINIGKSKETPVERAGEDYCTLLRQVYQKADYVAINISSPNTLNLRQLQARALIEGLLGGVTAVRNTLTPYTPLLVKIAPDLSEAELDDVIGAVLHTGIDGIIATNTTTSRAGLPQAYQALPGGLSGAPLRARSTQIIRYLAQQTAGKLPIIGVGGIMTAPDALEKLAAGAWLVQVYTGLIYSGPGLVRQINRAVGKRGER